MRRQNVSFQTVNRSHWKVTEPSKDRKRNFKLLMHITVFADSKLSNKIWAFNFGFYTKLLNMHYKWHQQYSFSSAVLNCQIQYYETLRTWQVAILISLMFMNYCKLLSLNIIRSRNDKSWYTVKPLLSGHPREIASWPLKIGWPLKRGVLKFTI